MWKKITTRMSDELFGFDRPETTGERVRFRLFELFAVVYAVYWAWDWGTYIQSIEGVVLPLGIANHLDVSFMFNNGVSLVNAGVLTVFILLGFFRVAPKWTYSLAVLAFHLHYASRYSLGEICHASQFVGMSVLALPISMWFSKEPKTQRRFALGAVYFFIGLGYVSAALSKLIATGPGWIQGRHLWLWIGEKSIDAYSKFGVLEHNWLQEFALSSVTISTMILAVGILTEAAGLLLWFRRTRPFIAVACVGMHFGIYLSMNIMFDMFIYQLLLIGLPWDRWIDQWLNRSSATSTGAVPRWVRAFALEPRSPSLQ